MADIAVVQVLGGQDIDPELRPLAQGRCQSQADLAAIRSGLERACQDSLDEIEFPIIQAMGNKLGRAYPDCAVRFYVLLTDQSPWLCGYHGDDPAMWQRYGPTDGSLWQGVLQQWCQRRGIAITPVPLPIEADVVHGSADWDRLPERVAALLNRYFIAQSGNLHDRGRDRPLERLIVQHNSGTPALCGSLYLWGIEREMAGNCVQLAYTARDGSITLHAGAHWQWRLKAPQVHQLLDLQDFAGALRLIEGVEFPAKQVLRQRLGTLDRAASFNLPEAERLPYDPAIERIAIALWSESAFRRRGQWMHWCLRLAGAFELACHHYLVANHADWHWTEADFRVSVYADRVPSNRRDSFAIPITGVIKELLLRAVNA